MSKPATPTVTPRAMRGFVLRQKAPIVKVDFDAEGSLWIVQGHDRVLISPDAIEVFKRGMTWVRSEIVSANS